MKTKKRRLLDILIWIMIFCQMGAWLYFMNKGAEVSITQYVWFTSGMMIGQIGASIDCIRQKAWPTLFVQLFFFATTGYGLYQRIIC